MKKDTYKDIKKKQLIIAGSHFAVILIVVLFPLAVGMKIPINTSIGKVIIFTAALISISCILLLRKVSNLPCNTCNRNIVAHVESSRINKISIDYCPYCGNKLET